MINRLRAGKCATKMYEPGIPRTYIYDITTSGIRPKSSFRIPKGDYRKILKNVDKIKRGVLRVNARGEVLLSAKAEKKKELCLVDPYRRKESYAMLRSSRDIWAVDVKRQKRHFIRPPKGRLPTNYESYNPSE